MIDMHAHILPGVDDGPQFLEESLLMLRSSFLQGVDTILSTSHFYANDEYPEAFLKRRDTAAQQLEEAMLLSAEVYPEVILGAEVLYFPGISQAEGIEALRIEGSRGILIEPPMAPWSEDLLDEIQQLGRNFDLIPIIAHVDRYMSVLRDETLIERLRRRDLTVQVNGNYFLNAKTREKAFHNLEAGNIQLIGSDCHNMDIRMPNLGEVRKMIRGRHVQTAFQQLRENAAELLGNRRM